jgi:hypothetical protein
MITQSELIDIFDYSDGNLIFKKNRWKSKAGKIAGSRDSKGYLRVRINWNTYSIHRLIWLYHHGSFPKNLIDHIDGDRTNNKIENLREATHFENNINCSKNLNNTSGYKNVTWRKDKKKWQVKCNYKGKTHLGGYFVDLSDAVKKATMLRDTLHGQFAKHC